MIESCYRHTYPASLFILDTSGALLGQGYRIQPLAELLGSLVSKCTFFRLIIV